MLNTNHQKKTKLIAKIESTLKLMLIKQMQTLYKNSLEKWGRGEYHD